MRLRTRHLGLEPAQPDDTGRRARAPHIGGARTVLVGEVFDSGHGPRLAPTNWQDNRHLIMSGVEDLMTRLLTLLATLAFSFAAFSSLAQAQQTGPAAAPVSTVDRHEL